MTPLVMPLTIIRNTVFEDFLQLPSPLGGGQDLTGYDLQAQLVDKPGGTVLATFACSNTAPASNQNPTGWVQIRLDDSVVIPTGYYRGTWSLLASSDASNPTVVAGGPVEIISQATTWA